MSSQPAESLRLAVRTHYAETAQSNSCCAPASCCGSSVTPAAALGYSAEDLAAVPDGANLGLGCGNPQAIAALSAGETVLDLGSGAGFDCFLAARAVGPTGHVIGVDMTPEMLARARANALHSGLSQVEFRLGEIEHLPLADASVDVILSNCVINLAPDKSLVFAEAFRVLRPGGRLAIADVVARRDLPDALRADLALYTGCIAGAARIDEIEALLTRIGFIEVSVTPREASLAFIADWAPGRSVTEYVVSANIQGVKPGAIAL